MDFAGIASFFESSSIVVWFAALVAVFALFVGLGLYAAGRGSRERASSLLDQARIDELVPPQAGTSARGRRRKRLPGSMSRSRREPLNHPQETS